MILKDFLFLIQDEEARIELEFDEDDKNIRPYHHFWLSDFRSNLDIAKYFRNYNVSNFSFEPVEERNAQIRIYIKKNCFLN